MSTPIEPPLPDTTGSHDTSGSDADTKAARRSSRRQTAVITASMLVTVVVVGLAWLAWPTAQGTVASSATSDQPSVTSTPAPSASTTSTPSTSPSAPATPGVLPPAEATTQVADFLAAAAAIAPDSTKTADTLSKVASGAIISEIENDQQELVANGWTQTGAPTVTSLTIVSTDAAATPATTVVEACVDSTSVVTLDSDGKPLAATPDQANRALNIFTLQQDGSSWRVIARTFPDNTTC